MWKSQILYLEREKLIQEMAELSVRFQNISSFSFRFVANIFVLCSWGLFIDMSAFQENSVEWVAFFFIKLDTLIFTY